MNEVSEQFSSVPLLNIPACRNTPPPRLAAVLLINIQSMTSPTAPDHITAPPSPPVLFSPRTDMAQAIPFAMLFVKLECLIVPLCPFQNIAPADLLAMLFSNVQYSTVPSEAPLFQSIAPPLVPAMLLMKLEYLNVVL